MKKIFKLWAGIIVLMLINDAVELVLAFQKRQKKLNREAVKRLRRNRTRLQPPKPVADILGSHSEI